MNYASKLYLALAGTAMLLAGIYGLSAQGPTPVTLLVAVAIGASVALVVTMAVGGRDYAPVVPADAGPPERRAITAGPGARGSLWPTVAAAGIGLAAVGVAIGLGWIVAGLLLALVGTGGWYGHTWREHPTWTPRVSDRMASRVVLPASLFWAILLCVLVTAVAFSRILLAVPEKASVAVALAGAVVLLVAFFVIASQSRTTRSVVTTLVVVTALAVGGAGLASGLKGERKFELVAPKAGVEQLVAQNVAFNPTDLNAKAGQKVTVVFTNRDKGTYHNFSVYEKASDGTQGAPVFNGKPINRGSTSNTFTAPTSPGTYIFACDFHANMRGNFTVAES